MPEDGSSYPELNHFIERLKLSEKRAELLGFVSDRAKLYNCRYWLQIVFVASTVGSFLTMYLLGAKPAAYVALAAVWSVAFHWSTTLVKPPTKNDLARLGNLRLTAQDLDELESVAPRRIVPLFGFQLILALVTLLAVLFIPEQNLSS